MMRLFSYEVIKITVDLLLRPTGQFGRKGEMYDVLLNGETIVTSISPEFAACRVLKSRGMTGLAQFWRAGKPNWDMRMDIETGAGLTIEENASGGPRVIRFREFSRRAARNRYR